MHAEYSDASGRSCARKWKAAGAWCASASASILIPAPAIIPASAVGPPFAHAGAQSIRSGAAGPGDQLLRRLRLVRRCACGGAVPSFYRASIIANPTRWDWLKKGYERADRLATARHRPPVGYSSLKREMTRKSIKSGPSPSPWLRSAARAAAYYGLDRRSGAAFELSRAGDSSQAWHHRRHDHYVELFPNRPRRRPAQPGKRDAGTGRRRRGARLS